MKNAKKRENEIKVVIRSQREEGRAEEGIRFVSFRVGEKVLK